MYLVWACALIFNNCTVFRYMTPPIKPFINEFFISQPLIDKCLSFEGTSLYCVLSPGICILRIHCRWPTACRSQLCSHLSFSANNCVYWLLSWKIPEETGITRSEVNKQGLTQTCCFIWNKSSIKWWDVTDGGPDTFLEWWDRSPTIVKCSINPWVL